MADPPFEMSGDAVANLIWSAKESALKVLRTGLRRDTRSVDVSLLPDPPVDGWQPAQLARRKVATYPVGGGSTATSC